MYDKQARCWKGYEPVPGKEPYSNDSCRPIGSSKKKKKEVKKTVKKADAASYNTHLEKQDPAMLKNADERVLNTVLVKLGGLEDLLGTKDQLPYIDPASIAWGGLTGAGIGVGGAVGGLKGLFEDPGYDRQGRKRSRLMSALKQGLLGAGMGAVGGTILPVTAGAGAALANTMSEKIHKAHKR